MIHTMDSFASFCRYDMEACQGGEQSRWQDASTQALYNPVVS